MGTNYYQRRNICEHCDRYDEKHIGKSSAGWQFSFQGYKDEAKPHLHTILSFIDWKKELQISGKIFDEYGRELSIEEFIELVEGKQSQPHNQYDHCVKEGWNMDNDWKDQEGYAFTSSDFS